MSQDIGARQGQRAAAWSNGDFILIETQSGRGLVGSDASGARHYLAVDVGDEPLGQAVLDALAHSRVLSKEGAASRFNLSNVAKLYGEWVQSLLERYGYTSRRALFRQMKQCSIQRVGEHLTIRPMQHERLESWGRTKGDGIEDIVLPHDSSAAAIGAALRTAFDRCV